MPGADRGIVGSMSSRPVFIEQLASRLGWLVVLRLLFLPLLFGLSASFYLRSGFRVGTYSNRVLLAALVANYIASATYYIALKRRRHVVKLASVELVVDQATWTALIYVTGGATSGATALYGLTCLAGAILIGPRGPLVAALAGGIFYFLLCAAFVTGAIGVPPDQPLSSYVIGLGEVIYPFFINLMVLMVVTLLAEYLAERLPAARGRAPDGTQGARNPGRLAGVRPLATPPRPRARHPPRWLRRVG